MERQTLSAREEIEVEVRFQPPAAGEHSGTLLLRTDGAPEAQAVPLRGSARAPNIQIPPSDLGAQPTGCPLVRKVRMVNTADCPLEVDSSWVEGAEFSLLEFPLLGEWAAGSSVDATVRFHREVVGSYSGSLQIAVADQLLSGALGAEAIPWEFEVDPTSYRFDDPAGSCVNSTRFTVYNPQDCSLEVEAWIDGDPDFLIDGPNTLVIAPVGSQLLRVELAPIEAGDFAGSLHLQAISDPAAEQVVGQSGSVSPLTVEDPFVSDGASDTILDLLRTLDGSGSMFADLSAIQTSAGDFIPAMGDYSDDWRVLATGGVDGCLEAWVDAGDPDPASTLEALFASPVPLEQGLNQGLWALEQADGCNPGLFREDASLHMLHVSDEPDQSPAGWLDLLDDTLALCPDTVHHAVAGTVPGGCITADPALGYDESVAATGGLFHSICNSEWPAFAYELLTEVHDDTWEVLPLSQMPLEPSLEILADGLAIADWTYEPVANAARLRDPDSLGIGADWIVRYDVALCPRAPSVRTARRTV